MKKKKKDISDWSTLRLVAFNKATAQWEVQFWGQSEALGSLTSAALETYPSIPMPSSRYYLLAGPWTAP